MRFWDDKGEIFDDILLARHDAAEINKLLVSLGQAYEADMTWESRKQENILRKAFYAPGVKEDL